MDLKKFDPTKHDGPLPSPCISICQMHHRTGLCIGCFRNLNEISAWSVASEAQKLQIWTAISNRMASA
jgi:predicted Fe-S protein YdhL (DUF1289 family)